MSSVCHQCSLAFDISPLEEMLRVKMAPVFGGQRHEIPPPALCPDCRQQRRLLWRNERSLYRRTCDQCKKSIIAMYPPDSPFTVYCTECWWSDRWDALSFGRSYDFQKPFFEQFRSLQLQIPRLALNVISNENSEYVNLGGYNKNCYLVFAMEYNEDCMFGTEVIKCLGCVDMLNCFESRYCYEVTDVEKCHSLFFGKDCSSCTDSWFLSDCRGCSDCILCTNRRKKQYCIRNVQLTKAEYEKQKADILGSIRSGRLDALLREFHALDQRSIHRASSHINCENVTGDYLKNSRNLERCFDVSYGEDCAHVLTGFKTKDLLDVCHTTEAELGYEGLSFGYGSFNAAFTHGSWTGRNLLYCDIAQSSQDLFGCVGTRNNRYCILNKQYSKEEYEALVPRIIEHMRKTGEWGEFFPEAVAPFAYNETTALQYFPMTREEVRGKGWPAGRSAASDQPSDAHLRQGYGGQPPLRGGWKWRDGEEQMQDVKKTIPARQLPATIDAVPDDILQWAILCEETRRPFKIVKRELEFYREHGLPLPRLHPDERHKRRMRLRNPRKLWNRQCAKCMKAISTSYAPERPAVRGSEEPSGSRGETVYCEDCYLKEVY